MRAAARNPEWRRRRSVAWVLAFALCSAACSAQIRYRDNEKLDSDRPEAWAMFHATSITLMSGLSMPEAREPGSISLGIEVDRIPQLSKTERTIGFDGTKEEDLNKAPLFARPRVTIALPWRSALILSYLPPVRVWGLKPNLFAAAFENQLYAGERWSAGARLYGQFGNVQGAFTCPDHVTNFPPGAPENVWGCEQQSTDRAYQRYLGLELSAARRIEAVEGLQAYAAAGASWLDTTVKVHNLTYGFADRSRLEAEDWVYSLNAGLIWKLDERFTLSAAAFYAPLEIVRPPSTSTHNEPLFNLRTMISYNL